MPRETASARGYFYRAIANHLYTPSQNRYIMDIKDNGMNATILLEQETLLTPETYSRLKDEAERRQMVLNDLVRHALETYVRDLEDETDEDIESLD